MTAPGGRARRQAGWSIALGMACVVALLAAACAAPGAPGTPGATTSALIGGATWPLLPAGPDGMRGRLDFDGADGMLFDLGQDTDPSAVQVVMDGVAIDLDIAWFAADGALVGTMTMPACPAEPCPRFAAPGPFRWAVEAPLGAFRDLDAGARLEMAAGQES